jgi:hypothetical protein
MRREDLPIANPCHQDWSAMSGDAQRRHCSACNKHVHDLSAMTEGHARRLLRRSPGVCVRYTCKSDGTVVHREHRAGATQLPRFLALVGAAVVAAPAWAGPSPVTTPSNEPTLLEVFRERIASFFGLAAEPVVMGEMPMLVEPPVVMMGAPPPPPVVEPVILGKVAPKQTIPELDAP